MSETLDEFLDKKTEVETVPLISVEGIAAIGEIIREQTNRGFYANEIEQIMEGREFVNKRGKLAKRIKRNLKKLYGENIAPEAMSDIGNKANQYTLRDGTYKVEITRDLAGTVGAFGDDESCFQEGHENDHHLFAMDDNSDFYAVRIYRQTGSRLARSWGWDSGDGFVVFNAYGMTLYKIAKITSQALNQDMRQIQFNFDGWLNDRNCYAIGGDPKAVTLRAKCNPERYQNNGQQGYCTYCDNTIYDDDDFHMADNGGMYCRACWDDNFHRCNHCHIWHRREHVHLQRVRGLHGTQNICPDCLEHFILCVGCKIRCHSRHITETNLGALCARCIENDVLVCNDCDDHVFRSACQYWQEDDNGRSYVRPMCADCYQDRDDIRNGLSSTPDQSPVCTDCGRWIPLTINENGQCQPCAKYPGGWKRVICGICGNRHFHPLDPELYSSCDHCSQCYIVAKRENSEVRPAVIMDRPCAIFCSISDDYMNCVECVQERQISNVHLIAPTFNGVRFNGGGIENAPNVVPSGDVRIYAQTDDVGVGALPLAADDVVTWHLAPNREDTGGD